MIKPNKTLSMLLALILILPTLIYPVTATYAGMKYTSDIFVKEPLPEPIKLKDLLELATVKDGKLEIKNNKETINKQLQLSNSTKKYLDDFTNEYKSTNNVSIIDILNRDLLIMKHNLFRTEDVKINKADADVDDKKIEEINDSRNYLTKNKAFLEEESKKSDKLFKFYGMNYEYSLDLYKPGQTIKETIEKQGISKFLDNYLPVLSNKANVNYLISKREKGLKEEEMEALKKSPKSLSEATQTDIPQEEVDEFLKNISKVATEYLQILELAGMNDKAKKLKDELDSILEKNAQSSNELGAVNQDVKRMQSMKKAIGGMQPDIFDNSSKEIKKDYITLLAWTANFEPFVTNINEEDNLYQLTPAQKDLYRKYGHLRLPLYRATTDGAIKELQIKKGVNMRLISLAEFIEKGETDELVLAARMPSRDDLAYYSDTLKLSTSNWKGPIEVAGKLVGGVWDFAKGTWILITDPGKFTQDIADKTIQGLQDKANETTDVVETAIDNAASTINDTINGTTATERVTDNPDSQSPGLNTDGTLTTETIDKANSTNVDIKGVDLTSIEASNEYILPIYVSSGIRPQSIHDDLVRIGKEAETIDPMKGQELNAIKNSVTDITVIPKPMEVIMSQHANLNYVNLINTLREQNYKSTALQMDMYKALYIDFLGNILTDSGYVVVPAAANYTYYMNVAKMPMFNAQFINAYPEVNQSATGTLDVSAIDSDKFIYIKTKNGLSDFKRINKNGDLYGETYTTFQYNSRTVMDDLYGTKSVFNFMPTSGTWLPLYTTYTDTQVEVGNEQDSVYRNTGTTVTHIYKDKKNRINLNRISNNGMSPDWAVLIKANEWSLEQSDTLNTVLMMKIAGSITKGGGEGTIIVPYEGGLEAIKNNWLNRQVGEKFEAIYSTIINSIDRNILFYTPSIGDIPILKNYTLILPALVVFVALLAYILFIIRYEVDAYARPYTIAGKLIKGFIAILLIITIVVRLFEPFIDLAFNKVANVLMSTQSPLFVIDQAETEHKNITNNFFNLAQQNLDLKEDVEITLSKLNREEVDKLREDTFKIENLKDILYLSQLDARRTNVIGDKIYLEKNRIKIKVKDLLDIIRIRDTMQDGYLKLEPYHTGYGEIGYYTPYRNIVESLTSNINTFSYNRKTASSTIQYRRGYNKTVGRTEAFIKSIGFIAPEAITDYLKDKSKEAEIFRAIENSGILDNKEVIKEVTNQVQKTINAVVDQSSELQEKTYKYDKNEDGIIDVKEMEEVVTKENLNTMMNALMMDIDLDDEEIVKYYEAILSGQISAEMHPTEILMAQAYIQKLMGGDLEDWLGLKKVLLLTEDNNPFPQSSWDSIKSARWYPMIDGNYDPKYLDKINEKIKLVNDRTKNFVIRYLLVNSGNVSDETLIKTTALYASMQFNKVFESEVAGKLGFKEIDLGKVSNVSVFKTLFIPAKDLHKGVNGNLIRYAAENTGAMGLGALGIFMILALIQYYIKLALASLIVFGLPYILIYELVLRNRRELKAIKGALIIIATLIFTTAIQVLMFRLCYTLTNNVSIMASIASASAFTVITTFILLKSILNVITDLPNFGYNKFEKAIYKFRGIDSDVFDNQAYADDIASNYSNQYYSETYNDYDYSSDSYYDNSRQYYDDSDIRRGYRATSNNSFSRYSSQQTQSQSSTSPSSPTYRTDTYREDTMNNFEPTQNNYQSRSWSKNTSNTQNDINTVEEDIPISTNQWRTTNLDLSNSNQENIIQGNRKSIFEDSVSDDEILNMNKK